ncbi:hypothetical protein ACFE04_027686 [Oxalis oulophora]
MAACGGLQHIFEKRPPKNPTLIESLSWNPVKRHVVDDLSFTEIFGDLHLKEGSTFPVSPLPSPNWVNSKPQTYPLQSLFNVNQKQTDNLQLCTEGLGFESSDDIGDLKCSELNVTKRHQHHETRVSSRTSARTFPPPISSIGKSGRPGVCFKSYRQDGRMVLKEVRIPNHEFLHAHREDGRLKMHFIHPTDGIQEDEEEGCKGKSNIERNEDECSECYEDACSDYYEDAD